MTDRRSHLPNPQRMAFALLSALRAAKTGGATALLVAASLTWYASLAAAATASVATPQYALTVLPTLECPTHSACSPAFDLSNADGINNKGWIVGDANVPGSTGIANATEHATLWRNGVITDLGTLGGPNSSIGFVSHPNDTGLITGNAQINTVDPFGEGWGLGFSCDALGDPCAGSQYEGRGFVWHSGVIRPLPTLGGNNAAAFGGANDRGQIVGTAENSVQDPTCIPPQVFEFKPVIWGPQYGQIHELPVYPGDTIGGSSAINDVGQVVGGSGSCGPLTFGGITHALVWQDGSRIDIGKQAHALGGQFNNVPTAINDRGQVVGWSDLPGDATTHAFLWQNGVIADLGTLPGDVSSFAYGVNDAGEVVGQSCDNNNNCRAFLWQNGMMTDLNAITDLNTPAGPFTLVTAYGINAQGEIVGFGVYPDTGQGRGWAAVPCDSRSCADRIASSSSPSVTAAEQATYASPKKRSSGASHPAGLRSPLGFGRGGS